MHSNKSERVRQITDSNGNMFDRIDEESPTFSFTYRQRLRGMREKYGQLHKYWSRFDKHYMQYWFGGSTNPYKAHNHIGIYSNREQANINKKNENNIDLNSDEIDLC